MGKKCIPGLFCIENTTLFILIFLLLVLFYFFLRSHSSLEESTATTTSTYILPSSPPLVLVQQPTRDTITDIYAPPLQSLHTNAVVMPPPIPPRAFSNPSFQQIGIVTPVGGGGAESGSLILPLMGRQLSNRTDKYQYYTMANGVGSINAKLPIRYKGKNGMTEYGCDEIMNGDEVYVEGYNTAFRCTIYENGLFRYT
jgi:hypothetical protein